MAIFSPEVLFNLAIKDEDAQKVQQSEDNSKFYERGTTEYIDGGCKKVSEWIMVREKVFIREKTID